MRSMPSSSATAGATGPAKARSAAGSAKSASAAVAGTRKRKATATHERAVVTAVIAFGLAAAVLGSVRVAGNVRQAKAKELMHSTFARVDQQQSRFRREYARYASWAELAERGVRLPARQQVRDARADESHWFLSLRDRTTGVVCDRIGELFDDPGDSRPPVCRVGAPGLASVVERQYERPSRRVAAD